VPFARIGKGSAGTCEQEARKGPQPRKQEPRDTAADTPSTFAILSKTVEVVFFFTCLFLGPAIE